MMKTPIQESLVRRLRAVQEAFNQPSFRPVMSRAASAPAQSQKRGNNWQDIIKKDEDDGQGGGGGGTIRGLRGKQVEQAKAAMRRLGRR